MRIVSFCLFLLISSSLYSQTKDEQAIRKLLAAQEKAWNEGAIEAFMKGYWESDSLLFVGKNGPKYGYRTTMENYIKSYPDKATMGKLSFQLIQLKPLSNSHYFVLGKWHLERVIGNVSGHFTLLLKKFGEEWKIVADHSS